MLKGIRQETVVKPGGITELNSKAGRFKVMKYVVVIELPNTGFSAYSPDLPECVTTGATREETTRNMEGAIAFHLEGLKLEGEPLPEPSSISAYVEAVVA